MGLHAGRHRIPTVLVDGFAVREIRPKYWLVDFMVDGRRIRKAFSDLSHAKTYCHAKRDEIINRGIRALDLPDSVREDALKAMEILAGTGATLVASAEEFVRRHPKTQGETFQQTCARYLEGMQTDGRRPASISDKRWKLGALCEDLGAQQTASIDEADINKWVQERGYRNNTARAYAGAAATVLAFFRGEKRRSLRNGNQKPPVTWSAETVAILFSSAEESFPEFVPALAVLVFSGLRPTELLRLTWAQIDLTGRVIRLTGEVTKTRTMRNVDISDNLLAWLQAYLGTGNIVASPTRYRELREQLMAACGIASWPTDVARHTYATMHYNAHQNAAATMAQLGHFGNPQTFVTHYKGVPVSAADVKTFWSIVPQRKGLEEDSRFDVK